MGSSMQSFAARVFETTLGKVIGFFLGLTLLIAVPFTLVWAATDWDTSAAVTTDGVIVTSKVTGFSAHQIPNAIRGFFWGWDLGGDVAAKEAKKMGLPEKQANGGLFGFDKPSTSGSGPR